MQTARKVCRVLNLAEAVVAAVRHRRRYVEHHVVAQVRLFLELLDVVSIRLGEYLPVDVAQLIARIVRPVLGKFDRKAVVRALMKARHEAFDNQAGAQLHVVESRYGNGVEKAEGGRTGCHEEPAILGRAPVERVTIRRFLLIFSADVAAGLALSAIDRRQPNILSPLFAQMDRVKAQLLDKSDLDRMLDRMAHQIVEAFDPAVDDASRLALIGMQTRGVYLAQRLHDRILATDGIDLPMGVLDATMYRDDFRRRLRQPEIRVTRIPFDITDRHLVLVDDVLYTGRTARAALDALMDLGRPASIRLLAVVDRGQRELPIRADIVGRFVPTLPGEEVRVRLGEIDNSEGVWLVDPQADDSSDPDNEMKSQE